MPVFYMRCNYSDAPWWYGSGVSILLRESKVLGVLS